MLISMLVNHMKVRVKYAYMLNKSSLDEDDERPKNIFDFIDSFVLQAE